MRVKTQTDSISAALLALSCSRSWRDRAAQGRRLPNTTMTELRKVGGFRQGFEAQYLNDPVMRTKIQTESTTYGISADTTALP